jgi:hypothetical protein
MAQVVAQLDRDAAIWADWVNGSSQASIAQARGLDQTSVSAAIRRFHASIPAQDRDAYRERILERLEALYRAHAQDALQRPRTAAIVRGILDSQARVLGLVKVEHEHGGQVDHAWTPGPTVAELLERWMAEGRIRPRVELTRADQ